MGCRRLLRAACGATLAIGLALMLPGVASTQVSPVPPKAPEFNGYNLTPSQAGGAGNYEWLGSYRVNGKQVWCVNYLYKAPGSKERYRPGETLRTKWNTPIPANRAADISYLLLRHGNTGSDTVAAAMAHIMHSWTAPAGQGRATKGGPSTELAYDAPFHLRTMPAAARAKVAELTAEAAANRGPWRAVLTRPAEKQVVGTPANWTVRVVNAKGDGVPDVPVSLTATQGTLSGAVSEQAPDAPAPDAERNAAGTDTPQVAPAGAQQPAEPRAQTDQPADQPTEDTSLRVRTDDDGTAVVALTPTGESPGLSASFASPNQTPRVQEPLRKEVQKVVLTGGEQQVTETSTGTARRPAGQVTVRKVDAETGKPVAGALLRITGEDRRSAAVTTDGGRLLGADNAPRVLRTNRNGVAAVPRLRAPQEICVVEAAAPRGYEDGFDKRNPPSACGTITDGGTLTLTVRNKPNAPQVPITIPAGGSAPIAAQAATQHGPTTGALVGVGAALLLAAGGTTLLVRRRAAQRR